MSQIKTRTRLSLPIGTRSVLYGAHAFWLHPFFVTIAWIRLYGWPWHPAIWLAFFVHDLGYWGKPNMDGPEGETHPILGARIVRFFFGDKWGEFTLLHSRWFSRRLNKRYSRLCVADKYSIVITPSWLYLPMVRATGELDEYMNTHREAKYAEMNHDHSTPWTWHKSVKDYIHAWVLEHIDADREDSWMSGNGADPTDPAPQLPGYLDGGYEPDRYIVLKRDGSPIDPKARYMVFKYNSDPHAVNACLAYAVSVQSENIALSDGIMVAIMTELGLTADQFWAQYGTYLNYLKTTMPSSPNRIIPS